MCFGTTFSKNLVSLLLYLFSLFQKSFIEQRNIVCLQIQVKMVHMLVLQLEYVHNFIGLNDVNEVLESPQ